MPSPPPPESPTARIDARIAELGDWRGEVLARARQLIHKAVPDVVEEWKWRGVPVWEHHGIICTGESYKNAVKLTFAKGAALDDPSGLFNASLDGNVRRAIDIHEGEKLDAKAFTTLVRAAAALNESTRRSPTKKTATKKTATKTTPTKKAPAKKAAPKLLSGGNPQIPMGYGDGPVADYIDAMPGWKREVGRRIDAVVTRTVPDVRKAVKWNTPFYGLEDQGWFLGFHCFTKYVKVTFFAGASLRPLPPVESKDPDTRYLHVHEDDLDEAQLAKWVKQAAARPGWVTKDIQA